MQWITICTWRGLSGGFDWTPVQQYKDPVLAKCPAPAPRQQVNLVGGGGVLVFCDPRTWPKDPEKLKLPEGWVAPVGAHPKYAVTSVIAILIACPG